MSGEIKHDGHYIVVGNDLAPLAREAVHLQEHNPHVVVVDEPLTLTSEAPRRRAVLPQFLALVGAIAPGTSGAFYAGERDRRGSDERHAVENKRLAEEKRQRRRAKLR